MNKKILFRFKSITHRLIFGCIVAALIIYGLSYLQARFLIHKVLMTWMLDITQSRLKLVKNEIEEQFKAIEQSVFLLNQVAQKNEIDRNFTLLNQTPFSRLLKTLVDQQPNVQAIAFLETPQKQSRPESSAWRYDRQTGYNPLNASETALWLNRCQSPQNPPRSHWSQPHPLHPSAHSPGITYCFPLSQTPEKLEISWLAIEVSLDWIAPFMAQQLIQPKDVNFLKLGDPFVLAPSLQPSSNQWIVQPTDPQRLQSWISQSPLVLTENPENHPLIQTQIDSKNTLIAIQIPSISWMVGLAFSNDKFNEFEQQYFWMTIASMSKDMVLMCLVIITISRLTTRSLRALIASTEAMAEGDLMTSLPPITSVDEVGRLTQSFARMQSSLQSHIQNLQETTAAKQKLESEITLAGQIQRTMLPRPNIINVPNARYEISSLLKPARMVGGDLYDFFLLDCDRLCIIVGDVAGKGFPAALLMACTITLIRTLTKALSTPVEILSSLNQELCTDNSDCQFVTLFCGILDLNTGKFSYASGGHEPPLLLHKQQVLYLDLETGPPLGLYEDAAFIQSERILERNALILLYTDGITEAMNLEGEIFSDERLIESVITYFPTSPARAIRTIQHSCRQFVGEAPQSDDMTLLALQYLPFNPFSHPNVMEWAISINSELTELEKVKHHLGQILQEQLLTVESIEDTQLIAEEVITNIIQYGYDNSNKGHIDLRLEINDNQLTLIFEDGGRPFNPITEIAPPDLAVDDEERSQGGFGFFLVQELSEKVEYAYHDGKNILTIYQIIAKIP